MQSFRARFTAPVMSVITVVAVLLVAALFPIWPTWLTGILGTKKLFFTTILNGLTLAGLYFLVASGFTIVFGLMRNLNLAHGSLYLLGGYIGYEVVEATGSWLFAIAVSFSVAASAGLMLQYLVFRRMEGEHLRQVLASIGVSIVAADLMLATWGGTTYQLTPPEWLFGAVKFPIVTAIRSSGDLVFLKYPIYRLVVLLCAIVIGLCLWLLLNRTKFGMIVRAGVDDREMLSASGFNVQFVFAAVFALGAGLAGLAGVIGGTALSISPGEDVRYLLASLVVVIVGGMGSIAGAAVGAVLVGLAEQFGLAYFPTYGVIVTFAMMIVVLFIRPQGLLGKA